MQHLLPEVFQMHLRNKNECFVLKSRSHFPCSLTPVGLQSCLACLCHIKSLQRPRSELHSGGVTVEDQNFLPAVCNLPIHENQADRENKIHSNTSVDCWRAGAEMLFQNILSHAFLVVKQVLLLITGLQRAHCDCIECRCRVRKHKKMYIFYS